MCDSVDDRRMRLLQISHDLKKHGDKLRDQRHNILQLLEKDKEQYLQQLKVFKGMVLNQFDRQEKLFHKTGIQLTQKHAECKHIDTMHTFLNLPDISKDIKLSVQKQCDEQMNNIDNFLKNTHLNVLQYEYHSFFHNRSKFYNEVFLDDINTYLDSNVNDDLQNIRVKYNSNKLVFVDGALTGILPELPAHINVNLVSPVGDEEQLPDDNDKKLVIVMQYAYNQSMIFQNIIHWEICIRVKSMQEHKVLIDGSKLSYEWSIGNKCHSYEGIIGIRGFNENGWCPEKILSFNFE